VARRAERPLSKEDAMSSRTIHDIAEAIAPSWEGRRAEVEELSAPVREWMLRALEPRAGETVLELAAGVGDTGFDAAALLGEQGRLISSDFSPAMLAAARRRGAARSVRNVEYRIIDAERIELGDGTVDGVLCRFGYMLMADPAATFAETRRVLRPRGRVALAVWGAPERNPWVTILAFALVQRGRIPPETSPEQGPFGLASAERTTRLLRGAGFADVHTEELAVRMAVPDVDEYMALIADTAGPVALALRGLADAEKAELRAEVKTALGRFRVNDGYEVPGLALCATARAGV
jgi:ubiquinone/menaquinone biosynthesis C-methylase UbiE